MSLWDLPHSTRLSKRKSRVDVYLSNICTVQSLGVYLQVVFG